MRILAKKIIFSDEPHFDLGGYINKQFCRIWGTENAWTTLGNIVTDRLTKDADFGKINHLITWSSFWSWRVCKQKNSRIWGTQNPYAYIEKPMHPKRVTVWCGFWSSGIIMPFFFKNEQREAVTVNGDRCRAMLNVFLFTKIEEEDIGNIWLQQNGATCHTAEATFDVLRPFFWWSYYQPQGWCRLATSELRFDTVGVLLVGCRQR